MAELCRRLDGMPLAIELAAARAGVLSVQQIAARLADHLDLLASGTRSVAPRQRTLRATLDWSYGLLEAHERRLFERLSVFAGGVALEAIEAVCSDDELPRETVLDTLARLVDKCMVVADPGPAMRYRLLETLRQYAREHRQAQLVRPRSARGTPTTSWPSFPAPPAGITPRARTRSWRPLSASMTTFAPLSTG